MKKAEISILSIFLLIALNSCEKNEDIDSQKPAIDLYIQDAFPDNCDTLYFGETFYMKTLFTDNVQLGSYSIDIHNNFDHHSHSTEVTEPNLDPIKSPVNPFVFIQDYSIPNGLRKYETNLPITIPSGNSVGAFDEGDYHFFISLTDKEGWSVQKGLSIKILYR
ncbi:MAG: DUF4625 domain-containing protein [Bacteroidales bacterium]|nr:DUF4625 domain-containing protein [Bacteroidales bacterium]MDD4822744.1 DUF4625 domain-containing protein [Bacteroidales bacterium]